MKIKGLNVLVVDDERSVAASVKAVLKNSGHIVDVLHDGEDALIRLTESPEHYHILITDHFNAQCFWTELLKQLHGKSFKGKILVLSGYLTLELEEQYRVYGVHKIYESPLNWMNCAKLSKPMRPASLA